MKSDSRESERKDTLNLLDYVVLDQAGDAVDRAMARTLNVSGKGILFETHLALNKGNHLLITVGLENDLCEIMGRIVRAEKCEGDQFCYGVEFLNLTKSNLATINAFLKKFKPNDQKIF